VEEDLLMSAHYDDRDAINTIRNLPQWWLQIVTAGASSPDPPADERGVQALVAAASRASVVLGVPLTAPADHRMSPFGVLAQAFSPIHAALVDRTIDAERRAAVDELLGSSLATISQLGRNVHATTKSQAGIVASINRSSGGAPKDAVDHADIGTRGLDGDRQRSRQHHGRPWQAVSMWSADVIDSLRTEGHPVQAGSAGENLTLAGLDWSRVGPGMVMSIGDVMLECSMWAEPCRHIAHCFSDGRWGRIHHDQGPVSRLYASVLRGGSVRIGDRVVVEPR
jgi:MOSC domain-containing protein YiiM